MIALNGRAELDHVSFAEVARHFVARRAIRSGTARRPRARRGTGFVGKLFGTRLLRACCASTSCWLPVAGRGNARRCSARHLAARSAIAGRVILNVVGVLQTVPSLALLALLITLLGTIGTVPALIALFLYALLPIVANTHAGLDGVSRGIGRRRRRSGCGRQILR